MQRPSYVNHPVRGLPAHTNAGMDHPEPWTSYVHRESVLVHASRELVIVNHGHDHGHGHVTGFDPPL
jgi:hypothetical protein